MAGVGAGIATTLGIMHAPAAVYAQVLGMLGVGAAAGHYIGKTMKITELPQMVAAFHSLVGLAAAATSIANVMAGDPTHLDTMHKVRSGRRLLCCPLLHLVLCLTSQGSFGTRYSLSISNVAMQLP